MAANAGSGERYPKYPCSGLGHQPNEFTNTEESATQSAKNQGLVIAGMRSAKKQKEG